MDWQLNSTLKRWKPKNLKCQVRISSGKPFSKQKQFLRWQYLRGNQPQWNTWKATKPTSEQATNKCQKSYKGYFFFFSRTFSSKEMSIFWKNNRTSWIVRHTYVRNHMFSSCVIKRIIQKGFARSIFQVVKWGLFQKRKSILFGHSNLAILRSYDLEFWFQWCVCLIAHQHGSVIWYLNRPRRTTVVLFNPQLKVNNFPLGISLKVSVIEYVRFELTYFEATVKHISHYSDG